MKNINKELRLTLCSFLVVVILSYLLHSQSYIKAINSTTIAFSYEYGFISRGFIGTIYQLIDKVISINMMTSHMLFIFVHIVTLIFIVGLLMFNIYVLHKCDYDTKETARYLVTGYTIWVVPTFISIDGFGRLDIYCLSLSLIMAAMIVSQRYEWMIPILSAISILIHHGNVFMFMNIPLVLLLYRAGNEKKKFKQNYYLILFTITFVVVSILFLYFEFFSHTTGQEAYAEIIEKAKLLNHHNEYHEGLFKKEILGINVANTETTFKLINLVQLPFFVLIMLPQILVTCGIYKNAIK